MLYKYFNYYYLFEVEMTGTFPDNNDDDDVHLVRLEVLLFSCAPSHAGPCCRHCSWGPSVCSC